MRVLFWKGKSGIFGQAIRLWTKSPYTHCELLFSDGMRFGIEYDRAAMFYEPPAGDRPWNPHLWDCLEFYGGVEDKTRSFCADVSLAQYDWLGIACSMILPIGREHSSKWFCSELTTAALSAGGYHVSGLRPHLTSPAKLHAHLVDVGAEQVLP